MLLVAAYYLPVAAYPSLVPCSASLSFAPDISFPCFCVSQDSLALKFQFTLLHITAVFFLFLTLSVLGGLFQFRQPLTQLRRADRCSFSFNSRHWGASECECLGSTVGGLYDALNLEPLL